MKKSLYLASIIIMLFASTASAQFVNGDFETGDWTGWTKGSGTWNTPFVGPNPSDYLPGGIKYDGGTIFNQKSAIVTSGPDPRTGGALNQVYSGTYSARVNNSDTNYHVSVISQTVNNWSDPNIFFAWAAVLEESHGVGDSGNFTLQLKDLTAGDILYQVGYDSASTPAYFTKTGNWYWSPWQVASLDVSARLGHNFSLTLLGSDCPYGGHAGYVYLDGFGATIPIQGAPEPATLFVMGLGLIGLIGFSKKFKK